MESLPPYLSPALLAKMDEILSEDKENQDVSRMSESDFDSDDSRADPDFDITKETQPHFRNILLNPPNRVFTENSNNNLRSIPSVYQSSESDAFSPGQLVKKRHRNPRIWTQYVRQNLRESGKEYTNIDGKIMPPRKIKPPCKHTCIYFCTKNFSEDDRKKISASFWNLSDKEKPSFYCKFVKQDQINRRRVSESTTKKNSYKFYLQSVERIHRVCKIFFFNTLDISERRIYNYFQNLSLNSCPQPIKKGRNVKRTISLKQIESVNKHIASFPTVDSHYCRASSSKKYLESHITITKMYELYRECTIDPVKISVYRKQFNTFNLDIHKPKKDQCDRCVIFKAQRHPTNDEISQYNIHKEDKLAMKAERDLDRQNRDQKSAIICLTCKVYLLCRREMHRLSITREN